MKRLSIKLRVTLWFTLMMVLLVAAVLTFLIAAGEHIELLGARNTLTRTVAESFDELEWDDGKLDAADFDSYSRGVYLAVYSADGNRIYGRLPKGFDDSLALSGAGIRSEAGENGDWLVYDEFGSISKHTRVWVRGAMPATEGGAFATMIRLAVVALPAIVLLSALIGYLLVAHAFRPIARITASAEQIADGDDLSRRIALGDGDDEVYRLAHTFDSMLERLQASFERERQFTSDVSHELRTPVSVVISQCEYALEHAETLDEARDALGSVLEQAKRMSSLTGQLLTLSRAGTGRETLHREELDLSELAELVAAQIEETARDKEITVRTEIEPGLTLTGDETMLMRMLLNLMENGVKYGKRGGTLTLTLRGGGNIITGIVADDGVGIAPEALPRIWDRFYQADSSRSGGENGVGLGLPMVRYIVTAHGGTVSVQSAPGQGSTFFFTLPGKSDSL